MTEKIIVRVNANFETEFLVLDGEKGDDGEYHRVGRIHALSPYEMMLASLGACTAMVVHTYAQNNDVDLKTIELWLSYDRTFNDDCSDCENIDRYKESIEESISFGGNLSLEERKTLFRVAHHCPIHKMFEDGIKIHSHVESTEPIP
ncbi:MAG: OsmC family protein [Anaerolineales bacterium]|jgi:uncharacterized OsmC-like protein